MAFGECAATICIARENGSLMLQTGQRVESNTEGGSFILRKSINPTPRPSNAIWIPAYHHYHSTAHEVLGVYHGSAKVLLGGEKGLVVDIHAGDVLLIPAGVAHKNLSSNTDFRVVGAYPEGQDWDMNYGKPGERPKADMNIERVAVPRLDPIYAAAGPLLKKWAAS